MTPKTKLRRRKKSRTETLYKIMKETLRQIATSGPNSTRDRRNAKATIDFVDEMELMYYPPAKNRT